MSKLRFRVVETAFKKRAAEVPAPAERPSDYFGQNVFNRAKMFKYLPEKAYERITDCIDNGAPLDRETADIVAAGMKKWAIGMGATHYTHWFHPLTEGTAEKHDAFVEHDGKGGMVEEFSGKLLIQQEPDASSFPNGGIRNTFEARGYSAWDPSSPAFIVDDTLCIPTVFIAYTGEALDQKTPLLRSMQAIDEQSLRILRLFGNTTAKRVCPSVGPEQEYFIVDRQKYLQRKDLIYTGRTLFGAMPPKGQEMDDHYFGSIRPRVGAFMKELNETLWRLGVSAKTQHNEVAPAQHELAPTYCQVNLAVDHNQMVMEAMKRVAGHHGLTCLLHEKPFDGINGSGKHNNWSLTSDDGINMMNPGETPHENVQFLLVLACIMKAVDRHADLLRESTAIPGNDHRLGAAEAPPAIISIFLGEQLEDVIDQLCSTGEAAHSKKGEVLQTGVATLPDFVKDATDRNRTSPFAFTGNKFEFRMVGSSDSVSSPNVVLNTIVAEAFKEAADELENSDDFDSAVHDIIKRLFAEHRRIIFSGNGYSEEWVKEAERRGLPNLKAGIDSVEAIRTEKAIKLFEEFGVYTRTELESRAEIEYEAYSKTVNIEAKTMIDMASKQILPAVIGYTKSLADTILAVKGAGAPATVQTDLLNDVSKLLEEAKAALVTLEEVTDKAAETGDMAAEARYFHESVVPAMAALRTPVDKLEVLVDKKVWPMPSYSDLLFEV